MRRIRRAPLVVLALLALGPALVSCSSKDETPKADPTATLKAAKKNLDATSGVRLGLTADKLPPGVNGLLDANGVATHAPAFTGSIKVSVSGVSADAAVVAVDHVVYAKLPFTSKFVKINPADYGAPDPSALLDPQHGLSSWLTAATDVQQGSQVRDGKRVLTSYTATVPGTAVAAVIPSATSTADFDARFTIDDRDRLYKAVLTGPFYPKADHVTYTVTFRDYGIRRDVKAP